MTLKNIPRKISVVALLKSLRSSIEYSGSSFSIMMNRIIRFSSYSDPSISRNCIIRLSISFVYNTFGRNLSSFRDLSVFIRTRRAILIISDSDIWFPIEWFHFTIYSLFGPTPCNMIFDTNGLDIIIFPFLTFFVNTFIWAWLSDNRKLMESIQVESSCIRYLHNTNVDQTSLYNEGTHYFCKYTNTTGNECQTISLLKQRNNSDLYSSHINDWCSE